MTTHALDLDLVRHATHCRAVAVAAIALRAQQLRQGDLQAGKQWRAQDVVVFENLAVEVGVWNIAHRFGG